MRLVSDDVAPPPDAGGHGFLKPLGNALLYVSCANKQPYDVWWPNASLWIPVAETTVVQVSLRREIDGFSASQTSVVVGATPPAPQVVGTPWGHPRTCARKRATVRHFALYKLPGAPDRFARNDFAALPAINRRWSPAWNPNPKEFDTVRATFSNRASLNAAFGYYRKLSPIPTEPLKARITVPVVVFAGARWSNRRALGLSMCRPDVRQRVHRWGGPRRPFHS